MRFGATARAFAAGLRDWDARSKTAMGLAIVLLVVVLAVGGRLPDEHRSSVVIALVGLLVAMQAIFLYANRGMVTHITHAQRLILAGRYDEAASLLEQHADDAPDVQTLTLLGGAYRMLGRVDDSLQILTKALQLSPKHHFARYSFGRTLLASGQYAQAIEAFSQALDHGAPAFARVDLAEAEYRAGRAFQLPDAAGLEPHVDLMARYILWRTGQGGAPDAALIDAGLQYWDKAAARFADTPYGADLQRDIDLMRGMRNQT